MKDVSGTFINFAFNCERAVIGHLYTFTSSLGELDYFTDLDIDVTVGGATFKSWSLRIDGVKRKIGVGVTVDEQTMKVYAQPTDTLFGANFLLGAEEGLLDGCIVVRQRAVWAVTTGNLAHDVANTVPVAIWTMFTGYVGKIDRGGQTHVEMKLRSPLTKLSVNMPRNYYQPGCLWTLFDQGCTLIKSNFAFETFVSTGSTANFVTLSPEPPIGIGADGIDYYAQGRLLFTSGVNSGLQVLIDHNDNPVNSVFLAYPLNDIPSAGDGVTLYPGCSKSFNTCQVKFSNQNNFRGFDKVPPIMLSA